MTPVDASRGPNLHDIVCLNSAAALQGITHSLICPATLAAVAYGLHLIINRLYCRVAIMPQMSFLPVPISSCFRLVVRRHSTMETKDRHCAAFRSSLAGPCSLRWPLPFSLSLPIEHVAGHRWTLKWSGLVNRRFLQALSVLTWWPPR